MIFVLILNAPLFYLYIKIRKFSKRKSKALKVLFAFLVLLLKHNRCHVTLLNFYDEV